MEKNYLYYGDNLEVLRKEIPDEYVDLIYLDPPFNSNRSYNVLFENKSGADAQAQIQAFDDSWVWGHESEAQYHDLISGGAPSRVADAIEAMRGLIGENDVLAYLVMMTPRLVELHRVLKPTGSLYLHCDPTASHYLKVVLDAVFGATNFRNEIVWRRTGSHTSPSRYETVHDTILFYAKSDDYYFHQLKRPYTRQHVQSRYKQDEQGRWKFITGGNILSGPGTTEGESGQEWRGFDPTAKGRHWAVPGYLAEQMGPDFKEQGVLDQLEALYQEDLIEIKDGAAWPHPVRYLNEGDGQFIPDLWAYQPGTEGTLHNTEEGIDADVKWLGPTTPERLGYQTQKPLGLLTRIIKSSCPPGGTVLDPFCGCGTTVDAAESLDRRWIGIDITYIAIDLITKRLRDTHGDSVLETFEVRGIPRDLGGARALFERSPFDFERWAVSEVDGQPNLKQVGDRGVDGVVRFPLDGKQTAKALVSVKGGKAPGPTAVRDLIGTVDSQGAAMGILITLEEPTRGMQEAARKSGNYTWPWNGQKYPRVQIVTVQQLLDDDGPDMPPAFLPYIKAQRLADVAGEQQALFDG